MTLAPELLDPNSSDAPWSNSSEWMEIEPVALAVVRVGMHTSLDEPGTFAGLQLPAVFHEPLPAFPVQVALQPEDA